MTTQERILKSISKHQNFIEGAVKLIPLHAKKEQWNDVRLDGEAVVRSAAAIKELMDLLEK